jgi:type IV secretion system protein VirD4
MDKKKKRAKRVVVSSKKIRLRTLMIFCFVLLAPTLYLSYCVSGLYLLELDISHIREQMVWCMLHPYFCYNERTAGVMAVGFLLWLLASFSAYSRMNYNFMHGNEFGSAKWGSIREFNVKYADTSEKETGLSSKNKVLSENIRFRYDSDTLRNNNVLVVGGSGAGKTAFFLTPNLLSLHDCNIYTDPKGSLVEELGGWLGKQEDTKVYVLNMCDMEKSLHFNPFLYIHKKSDISKLVSNLIQNTNMEHIKNSSQDPFWERAERMFLESLFLYVWLECPMGVYNPQTGKADLLERNWKSVMYLLNEAQFGTGDAPPKLDERMNHLEKKKPGHPAVRAYMRYRGGPDETIRSVLMTVNARMQPFDNEELLEIFTDNEIPLDEFGVGRDGDGKTKSNLFIVIPDDDDTFNFVPGMVYTLLFQELYRQARFFGGKLPLDVGFWFDEFANIKMPNNFDKILATCRSRGIYCVPILQSLAQLKTLFADGAWEGVAGNCDTFLYLGGNEASTYEYVSKLLGKWTIDKRTSGESKGSGGSYSENYDVLGRELMLEYEIRLLPDDECILFVRGENPIRDKKWFVWEHPEYVNARKCGAYLPDRETNDAEQESCCFISKSSLDYLKKQEEKNAKNNSFTSEGIHIYGMDAYAFMMMDMDEVMEKVHDEADQQETSALIQPHLIRKAVEVEAKRKSEEQHKKFEREFREMSLLDIYSSNQISRTRREVIRELIQANAEEETIKRIICPELIEAEVQEKKRAWLEMRGRLDEN